MKEMRSFECNKITEKGKVECMVKGSTFFFLLLSKTNGFTKVTPKVFPEIQNE